MGRRAAAPPPPPSAKPLTAAMTGLGDVSMARNTVWPRADSSCAWTADRPRSSLMSAPAANPRPDRWITAGLGHRLAKLGDRDAIEGVKLVRAVERDRGDPLTDG